MFWVFPILFFIFIIVVLYVILSSSDISKNNQHSAMRILRRRYARGKITEKEFKDMKENLLEDKDKQ